MTLSSLVVFIMKTLFGWPIVPPPPPDDDCGDDD
jgi:hypothetical protein